MLLDANLLLYAVNRSSTHHESAVAWIDEQLAGARRVGLPMQSLTAFVRISTHPRVFERPLDPEGAWQLVSDWLAAPVAWVPEPGPGHIRVLGDLVTRYEIRGNLVPDAALAALAIEHGLDVCSTDTDFARFGEIRWVNPLA